MENWTKRIINNVLVPLGRIIKLEKISENYNYLPPMGKSSLDYAWAFYYNIFENVERAIKDNANVSSELQDELLSLNEEIRRFVVNFGSYNELSSRWFEKKRELYYQTTRPELYSDLKEEGAYDLIEQFGFDELDEVVDDMKTYFENNCKSKRMLLLLQAYLGIAIDIMEPYMTRNDATYLLKKGINETKTIASREEVDEAKRINKNANTNIEKRKAESRLRIATLKKGLGDFKIVNSNDGYAASINSLEKEHHFTVYHVVENEDEIIYLGVFPEYLYWENLRMDNASHCFVEKKNSEDESQFEVVVFGKGDKGKLVRSF